MATFTSEIDIELNIEENVGDGGEKSKRELFVEYYRGLPPFEQKKFLVDALYVPNYYDDDALRKALEPIITAR